MITNWLKFWADQAGNRTERKQRLALIEAHFPHAQFPELRAAGRRPVRTNRPNCPIEAVTT